MLAQLDPSAHRLAKQLPEQPGIYAFYSATGTLLYIGKSVNLRRRVSSHFSQADLNARHLRMMRQTTHITHQITHQITAGEIGALLLECQQIKSLQPLYNRALRQRQKLWTLHLNADCGQYLRPIATLLPKQAGDWPQACYGVFHSKAQGQQCLETLAHEQGFCRRRLGLESGTGACFGWSIKRCRGACVGEESAQSFNQRLRRVLQEDRLQTWPYAGAILIREQNPVDQHTVDWHWVDGWCYLGTSLSPKWPPTLQGQSAFDKDSYHIILKALRHPHCQVHPMPSPS